MRNVAAGFIIERLAVLDACGVAALDNQGRTDASVRGDPLTVGATEDDTARAALGGATTSAPRREPGYHALQRNTVES